MTWTGECAGGKAQGTGTTTWTSGVTHTGRYVDGKMNGHWVTSHAGVRQHTDRPQSLGDWKAMLMGSAAYVGASAVGGDPRDAAEARRGWVADGSGAGVPSSAEGSGVVDPASEGNAVDGVLAPNTPLGAFEIEEVLGVGGFGVTYLARDTVNGRRVAIKTYLLLDRTRGRHETIPVPYVRLAEPGGDTRLLGAAEYRRGLSQFREEARALERLSHPNVVRVLGVFDVRNTACLVMEYVEGRSLAEELVAEGPLPEARVRAILAGLMDGLSAVHSAGLLHLDVKPANVMLRERDGASVLIDFGAVRQDMGWRSLPVYSRRSCPMPSMLTPGYAPIEQYEAGNRGPWKTVETRPSPAAPNDAASAIARSTSSG